MAVIELRESDPCPSCENITVMTMLEPQEKGMTRYVERCLLKNCDYVKPKEIVRRWEHGE